MCHLIVPPHGARRKRVAKGRPRERVENKLKIHLPTVTEYNIIPESIDNGEGKPNEITKRTI